MSLIYKLFRLIVGPPSEERALADDEEERIFYDKETGKSRVEVVKKTPGRMAAEAEATKMKDAEGKRYPAFEPVDLKHATEATLVVGGEEYSVATLYSAAEPEDRDVLSVTVGETVHKVHTYALFDALVANPGTFWSALSPERASTFGESTWHKSNFCDDGREYFEIKVGDQTLSMFSKYLGAEFYLTAIEGQLILLTRGLVDADAIEVPDILTELDAAVLAADSAVYDEEEEWWEYFPGGVKS